MSTCYSIVCHNCRVECDAARVSGSIGPFCDSVRDLQLFVVQHAGHHVDIINEHITEVNGHDVLGYAEFDGSQPDGHYLEEDFKGD